MLTLIARQGLHATPMSQLAKEAHVAAGTIYHYFSSKEALIHELYLSIYNEFRQVATSDQVDERNYAIEFSAMCLRLFKYMIQNPEKFYFFQQYEHTPIEKEIGAADDHSCIADRFIHLGLISNQLKSMPVELISGLVYNNLAPWRDCNCSKNNFKQRHDPDGD